MRIVNLIENTPGMLGCLYEHGLSFYVVTPRHRLLVDTGSTAAFAENAKTLGIDLMAVDTLVLSHGHYDHSGGMETFVRQNPKARIYIQESADGAYYHMYPEGPKYIGISEPLTELLQVTRVKETLVLDEELILFSEITGRRLWPTGNAGLMRKEGDYYVPDNFRHEQCLVIQAEGKRILMSGCAHNGVLNILERYAQVVGGYPDVMISGFHMKKSGAYTPEEEACIRETGEELVKLPTRFYTGHCTGEHPFAILKEIMGEQLVYVHSGEEIVL